MNSTLDYKPAGFFRRMVALFYDLILIIALCVGLTLLITYALNTEVESPLMYLVFLALGVGFYSYFWKKNKGQTLGMQVWKVRLAQENNLDISLMRMIYRCLLGLVFSLLFGLNYLPMLFRKDKKTLNDILSKTFLVKV
jgi:uncharacterized RDD family membrane protein YckC